MTTLSIDLNCDLGERDDAAAIADDLALLDIVTSANIACGGHAGDQQSMKRTVVAAMERGVALGAHPGYPDRANFGRVACAISASQLEESLAEQIATLWEIAHQCGGLVNHVKPHGALYHAAMQNRDIAELLARAVARAGLSVILVGQAHAPALNIWREMGSAIAAEAFADRQYEADGSLRSRAKPNAMIDDPARAARQAIQIARGLEVATSDGGIVQLRADTICLHSDTPNSAANARAVRDALTTANIHCQALRR